LRECVQEFLKGLEKFAFVLLVLLSVLLGLHGDDPLKLANDLLS
jgi:hypothetical protein